MDYNERINYPLSVGDAIALFETTRFSDSIDEIFKCLVKLNPVKLDKDVLMALVWFVERMSRSYNLPVPHINIFGTGGDKTINISTITGIVASQEICVIKIGTKAVTSHWGSSEFIAELDIQNKQRSFKKQLQLPTFKQPSKFIPLSTLGFVYGDELREARRKLKREGILDIYKTIFPSANFTGHMGRITGYYDREYYDVLANIAQYQNHNVLLVHSASKIDELMPGEVLLTHIIKKEVTTIKLNVPGEIEKTIDFFSETDDLKGHIDKYEELLSNENHFAWQTIAYNVASCFFLRNRGVGGFNVYLDKSYSLIHNLCRTYVNPQI